MPTQRIAVRDDNRRAVDEAAALGAPCLVIVVGGLPQFTRAGSPPSKDIAAARAQVRDGLAEMLEYAAAAGMQLALEPLHPMTAAQRSCVNTLRQALDLCDELDPGPLARPRRRARRLSRVVGLRGLSSRSRASAATGCSPSTSATGWCRPPTCSTTAA